MTSNTTRKAQMMTIEKPTTPLITKWRPRCFETIVGHESEIESIQAQLKSKNRPHVWFFSGPPGGGKTTLAKIIATEVGCSESDLIERDGARFGKAEDIRELVDQMSYLPMFGKVKVVIIDECHVLSATAFQALLKPTEDCPEHCYWIFCTSEPSKVPAAIKNRATSYALQPVPSKLMLEYGQVICELEDIKLPVGALEVIVDHASGSPRQMLNSISKVSSTKTVQEVFDLLGSSDPESADDGIILIARLLVRGCKDVDEYRTAIERVQKWSGTKNILKAYMSRALWNSWNIRAAKILEAIDKLPDYPEYRSDIMLMISRLIFN